MNELMIEMLLDAGFELVTDDLPPVYVWGRFNDESTQQAVIFNPHSRPHAFVAYDADERERRGVTTLELQAAIDWLNTRPEANS